MGFDTSMGSIRDEEIIRISNKYLEIDDIGALRRMTSTISAARFIKG